MLELTNLLRDSVGLQALVASVGDVLLDFAIVIDVLFLIDVAGELAFPRHQVIQGDTLGVVLLVVHLLLGKIGTELVIHDVANTFF